LDDQVTLELPGGNEPEPKPSLAGRLFGGAAQAARLAARTGYGIAKQLPGADLAERGLQELERTAVSELRKRLDSEQDPHGLPYAQSSTPGVAVITTHGDFAPLRASMAELLQRSLSESSAQAREDLYASTLSRLTPDEARILAALSDGTPFALVDVAERVGVNGVGQYLVRNASSVGKAAGLTLADQVQVYVGRMRTLDLALVGDEAPELSEQYDILLTEESIRTAIASARRTKVIRRTLRISPFGAQFWAACDPSAWS
jgi:hypothetical protein